jgi:hypothetical protein
MRHIEMEAFVSILTFKTWNRQISRGKPGICSNRELRSPKSLSDIIQRIFDQFSLSFILQSLVILLSGAVVEVIG